MYKIGQIAAEIPPDLVSINCLFLSTSTLCRIWGGGSKIELMHNRSFYLNGQKTKTYDIVNVQQLCVLWLHGAGQQHNPPNKWKNETH